MPGAPKGLFHVGKKISSRTDIFTFKKSGLIIKNTNKKPTLNLCVGLLFDEIVKAGVKLIW